MHYMSMKKLGTTSKSKTALAKFTTFVGKDFHTDIPYSGKYWRGRNIGGFGGLENKTPNLYQPIFCLTYQARVSSSIVEDVAASLL